MQTFQKIDPLAMTSVLGNAQKFCHFCNCTACNISQQPKTSTYVLAPSIKEFNKFGRDKCKSEDGKKSTAVQLEKNQKVVNFVSI